MSLTCEGASHSDPGRQRPENEDWIGSAVSRDNPARRVVWAIADGVSGSGTGRDAARLAVETVLAVVPDDRHSAEAGLRDAIERANGLLIERRSGRRRGGASYVTTILVVALEGPDAWIAHVGDCRAYLVRDGAARQLTRDHTWVAEQVALGRLRPEQAASHPRRNVITRSLGQDASVAPDVDRVRLRDGDVLVLCTDGLTRHVADDELARFASASEPDGAVRALVDLANVRGGTDNVTVAVVRARDVASRPAAAQPEARFGSTPPASRPADAFPPASPSLPPTPSPSPRSPGRSAVPPRPGIPATTLHERILRSVSSGIVTLDDSGTVTSLNPAAEAMLVVATRDVVGRGIDVLLPPALRQGLGALFSTGVLGPGATVHGTEMEGELPGRGHVYFRHRLSPLRDEAGTIVGYVLVLDDETERVRLERRHRQADAARERVQSVFERYVAPAVFDELMRRGPDAAGMGGEQRDLTVLFADIRGFTALAEQLPPGDVVGVLNGYLSAATDVIFRHEGTIDKFIGDAIMALFGAPVRIAQHPLRAVRAALAMQEAFARLPAAADGRRVSFGVGINTGEGIVGTIGAPRLMSYTAIGDVVNVAARLQGEARAGEILVAEGTYRQVAGLVAVEELGSTHVKGRTAPVKIYKVVGLRAEPPGDDRR